MSIKPLTALSLSAVLLCGCATVGPQFKPEPSPAVVSYTAPGETAPAQVAVGAGLSQDWWSLFQSPEIDTAVRQALAGNQSLQATRERLTQAREAVRSQAGQLEGSITADASRQHINLAAFGFSSFGGVALENPTVNLYSVGASARYDFDLFGSRKRERETRQALERAAAEELNAAQLTLSGQVVSQAVTIAAIKAQIAAVQDIAAGDRDLVTLTQNALQGGSGTRLDVTQAQTQLAADEAVLPPLQQQLAVARHALALLVGRAPGEFTPPDFSLERIALPGALPVAMPSELAHRRPDIQAAEARLQSAVAQVGVAEARLYPNITITGNFTQTALEPGNILDSNFSGWSLGPLGINAPIFGRGELKAQQRGAEAAARAAAADYRQAVLQAFVQVADVLQALQNDEASFAAEGRALAVAEENLRLNRLRYQGGKSGSSPVIDAQRAYQRARLAYVRAQSQRYMDAAQLLLVTGGGWTGGQPSDTANSASTKG